MGVEIPRLETQREVVSEQSRGELILRRIPDAKRVELREPRREELAARIARRLRPVGPAIVELVMPGGGGKRRIGAEHLVERVFEEVRRRRSLRWQRCERDGLALCVPALSLLLTTIRRPLGA